MSDNCQHPRVKWFFQEGHWNGYCPDCDRFVNRPNVINDNHEK